MENKKINEYLSKSNLQLLSDFKWGSEGESDFHQFMYLVREQSEDQVAYDKMHMAYCMMKDLLIKMNGLGELEGYNTEKIFKMIGELEKDN